MASSAEGLINSGLIRAFLAMWPKYEKNKCERAGIKPEFTPKRVQIEVLWVDPCPLYKLDSYAFAWLEQHVLSSSGPKDMAVAQYGVGHLARRSVARAIPLHGLKALAKTQP